MTQGYDDKGWEAVVDALAPFADIADVLLKLAQPQAATEFVTNVVTVVEGAQPVLLLGLDPVRARALVRANTDGIYIGSYSQLAGNGLGYPVQINAGDEIKTIDDIYVIYRTDPPTGEQAAISVWAERLP